MLVLVTASSCSPCNILIYPSQDH